MHERVVAVFHELNTELLEEEPDAERGAPHRVLFRDGTPVLRSLDASLQNIKHSSHVAPKVEKKTNSLILNRDTVKAGKGRPFTFGTFSINQH